MEILLGVLIGVVLGFIIGVYAGMESLKKEILRNAQKFALEKLNRDIRELKQKTVFTTTN